MKCALITISAICTIASASPDRVRDLLMELSIPSGENQVRIQFMLMTDDPTISLEDIETVAIEDDLSADQLQRLDQAALARFRSKYPMGGLGVQFGATRPGHIEIQSVVGNEGFPASTMLKPGDIIVEVDGKLLEGSEHVRAEILSRRPGEMLPVVLLRDGLHITRELPLGSYTNLSGPTNLDDRILQRALRLRRERLGILFPTPEIIGSQIDPDDWIAAAFPDGVASSVEQTDEMPHPGILLRGQGRVVYAGYPLYPRRGRVWSSRGIAQQAILEVRRAEISAQISDGFARRAQLVARINSVKAIGESQGSMDDLEAEFQMLQKQRVLVEREVQKLSEQLDELARSNPAETDRIENNDETSPFVQPDAQDEPTQPARDP